MTTTIEKLNQLTTTTQEKDTQYLNEIIQEIKIKRNQADQKCIHQKNYLNENEQVISEDMTLILRKK